MHTPLPKKVMIIGANSKTAESLVRLISMETNFSIIGISRGTNLISTSNNLKIYNTDFTDRKAIKEVCLKETPDVIVNTAAMTNVDECEEKRQEAWTVNVRGVENLIQMCRILDAHLIHISSDYIFDGTNGPYSETDVPNPLCYYGKTKLAGENACLSSNIKSTIVRTNVIYGASRKLKPDFVTWVLNKLSDNEPFRVVDDQINNPTLVDDLALAIKQILEKGRTGIYNTGGADWLDRYRFALCIADVFGYSRKLISTMKTSELAQKAPRPLKAGLVTLKAETDLNIKFSTVESGLRTMRRQLQMFGYREWKL